MKHFLFSLCTFFLIGIAGAQTLTEIIPSTGGRNERISFTITAQGTHFSTVLAVYLTDSINQYWLYADSVVKENDTAITGKLTIPKYVPNTILNLHVYSQGGGSELLLKNAFQIEGGTAVPLIKSIVPATGARGDHINCTINCSDMGLTSYDPEHDIFLRVQDSMGQHLTDITSITILNDSVLQGSFDVTRYLPDGSYNVLLSTIDNYAFSTNLFTVSGGKSMAKILSVTPDQVMAGDGMKTFRVACSGTSFKKYNAFDITTQVSDTIGNYMYMNKLVIVNDSTLDIDFYVSNSLPEAQMNFEISSPEGTLFLANAIKVTGPKILSMTPVTGGRKQKVRATITCSHTAFTSSPEPPYAYLQDYAANYHVYFDSISVINDSVITGVFTINRNIPDQKLNLYISLNSGVLMVLKDAFEVSGGAALPAIVSVNPPTGERKKEVELTIKTVGMELSSFYPYQVQPFFDDSVFNSYWLTSVTIVNDSTLKGKLSIPANLLDGTSLNLYISTPLDYVQLNKAFTISGGPVVPHVISVTPSSGGRGDKLNVTITCTGTEFTPNDPEYDIHIQFMDNAGNYSVVDSIVIVNDSVLQGRLSVSRFHQDNASLKLQLITLNESLQVENAFLVNGGKSLAGIVSVDPDTAKRGELIHLKINCTGTEFTKAGSGLTYADLILSGSSVTYDIPLTTTTITNDTLVEADLIIPRHLQDGATADLRMNVEGGGQLYRYTALTIIGGESYGLPSIESVSPSVIENGKTVDMVITCKNTVLTENSINYVDIQDAMVNSWTVIDRTTIKVNIQTWDIGYKSIRIYTAADGVLEMTNAFEVITNPHAPQIIKVDPPILYKGTQLDVTITARNTHFTQANVLAAGFMSPSNAVTVKSIEVINDTVLKCNITVKNGIDNEACYLYLYDDIDGGSMTYNTEIWIVNTGVQEQDGNGQRLIVYPNPTSGMAYMDITFPSNHPYQLNVMNITGTLVYSGTESTQSGKQTVSLNKEQMGLKEGFYFVQLKQDDRTYYAKLQIR